MSGPAGKPLNSDISSPLTASFICSDICCESSKSSWNILPKSSFALSITYFLLLILTSSIFSTLILAKQGPTLSIVSIQAAIKDVSELSKDDGIVIIPVVLPLCVFMSTSILPILPVFCNSLNSISGPSKPSVCPKTAPITSGFSMVPSASNLA